MSDDATMAVPSGGGERTINGRYRLVGLLGRGGTADVWRAEDEALGRTVALKLVTVPTDESAARAGDEARLLARLNHPGLVPVYDAGTDEDDRPWVVMELVEGETLSDTLKRGPLELERTASVGRSIADALAYVHAQGLVHRDVKPGNILIGKDGRVRLTDFGIARLVDAARVTSTGMMVGTASYLAPEQVAGEKVGPPADVYALGLVLLECLTGEREYAGGTVEVALARLHRDPDVPTDLPGGWTPLLTAMTDRDPLRRPTPAAAALDLGRLAAGGEATQVISGAPVSERTQVLDATRVAAATRPAPRPAPRPEPRPAPVSRPAPAPVPASNGWKWGLALAGLVAALIAGFLLFGQSRDPGPYFPPSISEDLPPELRDDLRRLQEEVGAAGSDGEG